MAHEPLFKWEKKVVQRNCFKSVALQNSLFLTETNEKASPLSVYVSVFVKIFHSTVICGSCLCSLGCF